MLQFVQMTGFQRAQQQARQAAKWQIWPSCFDFDVCLFEKARANQLDIIHLSCAKNMY